jgi:hypothetical protein
MPLTFPKAIKEIRATLEAVPERKTDKDKLRLLAKIKMIVEFAEEPLKKQHDAKQAAYDKKTKIIKKALKQFLTALDKYYSKHGEMGDTDVRDQMYAAIYRGFIQPQRGYALPERFGMFSDEGNAMVRAAFKAFLTHPEVLAASKALKTPQERFDAFQDESVETAEGMTCFEYFGHSAKVRVP